jgi:hypothetical protein
MLRDGVDNLMCEAIPGFMITALRSDGSSVQALHRALRALSSFVTSIMQNPIRH